MCATRAPYVLWVFFTQPLFLPVNIQHNQRPCRFFNPRRDKSYVVTKLRHKDTTLPRMQEAQRYWVPMDTSLSTKLRKYWVVRSDLFELTDANDVRRS